jgi:glycosyltransferase involved in cell wall biosynthesis
MKILHAVPSFGLGGMEKVICSIINSTADKYDHELLSIDNSKEAVKWTKTQNVRLIDFHKFDIRHVFFKSLYKIIKARKPHVLMTYNWGSTDAIWLGRLAGVTKIIHNEHGFNIDEAIALSAKRSLVRFFVYRMASKTIVVSNELLNIIKNKFYLNHRKLVFIPNGIDTDYYIQNFSERERVRVALGFKNTDFVIGFSGRLDPVKNFDLMVKVFLHCLRNDSHFKLLFIGDGPEKEHIENLCKGVNIQKHVLLAGKKDEVLPYLRALDAFLLTSHREQMPMTILEAMSVGIPVVASKVGEIPHMIDDGMDGFLVSPNMAPETWSRILISIKNNDSYKNVGILAREKIMGKFQEETMVSCYKNVLESVIHD